MAEQQSPDILLWRHEKLVSFHSSLETGIRLRGNGTLNIIDWCDENGNPPPTWSELAGSVFVTFAPAFGETTPQVTDQVTLQVTPQVARVLEAASSACSFAELQAAAGLKDRVHEKIEQLGRLVFDESFQVEISKELQIASRTTKGVTVPFDSLSGGTREQLSLIFRLACSMIVAKDGGTPLILDDALGYTDPERLRLMGAVLAKAAKECQVVIFTCVPDRYNNVGQATIVSMR